MSFSSDSTSLKTAAHRLARLSLAGLAAIALAPPAQALIYTYTNTTSGTFADQSPDNAGACSDDTPFLDRTFVVTDSFTVNSISVGINISHGRRGDVRAELFRPGSTTPFVLIPGQSGGGDQNTNYDIYISQNTEGTLNDNDTDPASTEPYFFRLVPAATNINNFYTGDAFGTWTLRMCDVRDNNVFEGTFNRAMLVLTSTAAATTSRCSAVTRLDWNDYSTSTTTGTNFTSANIGGVTVTETETADFGSDGQASAPGNFVAHDDTFATETGYYSLYMDAAGTNGNAPGDDSETVGERVTFTYSIEATNPSFTVNDIDWFNDPANDTFDFEDQVRVFGFNAAGARVPFTYTNIGDRVQNNGDVLEGDNGDSGTNETRGTARITFDGPIKSFSVEYAQGDEPPISADDQRITIGEISFCAYDYGDAPSNYGTVARQAMGSYQIYMGARSGDGEIAQQSGGSASGDDSTGTGGDDEDGIASFPAMNAGPGGTYTIPSIVVHNTSGAPVTLCGWIDFDINGGGQDGTFQADEGSCITVPASGSGGGCIESPTGTFTCSMSWIVPADYVRTAASYYSRFRVTPAAAGLTTANFNSNPTSGGNEFPGEIEDYEIPAATLPVTLAFVETVQRASSLDIRFATATETANAGFRIWGTDGQGKRSLVASLESNATDSFVPQEYEATIRGGRFAAIEIEDLSVFGKSRLHGPFAVGSTFGEEPQADAIDWAAIRGESGVVTPLDRMRSAEEATAGGEDELASMRISRGTTNSGLLLVREEGIHRVTYEQLLAAGIDLSGAPAGRIAVIDNGVGVPRHVETPGGLFGAGSYIEFVARPQLTLASPVDAYVLMVDTRKAIPVAAVNPGLGGKGTTWALDRYRPDQSYSFSSPNGDPWFDARALAWGGPATLSRTFDLPDLKAGTVRIKVRLWGYGDFDGATPDHHAILKLNGSEIGQRAFDGLTAWEPEIDVTGLATASGNTLELNVPGDTGYAFDNIALEGFEVSYPRAAMARNGRFQGTDERLRAFAVGGFGAEPVAIWKSSGNSMTRQLRQPVAGAVSAAGGSGTVYAASQSQLLRPGIVAGVPAAKRSSTAEYVIVTHPAFASSVVDLAALEEGRGLSTEVVTVDQIFAAYSDHASSAVALKSFLSASLATGNLRYVLLVGADTTDPYDHLGMGSISYVPTDFRDVSAIVRFSPTDESLVDRQNDGLGDVPIGRLPVRTTAELDAVIAKLYAWEAAIGTGQPSALMTAGLSDGARSISTVNEAYAGSLPGWNTVLAQVDDAGSASVRQQILNAIDAGAHLVSYVGHSSMGQWDQTPLLKWQDATDFTNAGLPNLITAWGCWNSYYVEPTIESLSARLLRQPDAGAAGTIGATTLTTESSHRQLGTLFFARVNAGAATVGEAFHGAKQDMQAQGGAADAIYGMTLLGDPAMSLPHP